MVSSLSLFLKLKRRNSVHISYKTWYKIKLYSEKCILRRNCYWISTALLKSFSSLFHFYVIILWHISFGFCSKETRFFSEENWKIIKMRTVEYIKLQYIILFKPQERPSCRIIKHTADNYLIKSYTVYHELCAFRNYNFLNKKRFSSL